MYRLTNTTSIIRNDGACIPADMSNVDYANYLLWIDAGNTPEPYIVPPITVSNIVDYVQNKLDAFVAERGYSSILSACTYATSTVPRFQIEGQRAVEVRDNTWSGLYSMLAEVENGKRIMPTDMAEVDNAIPSLTWV